MKILTFDIETSPHLSFHFNRWQENIPQNNTVDESSISCWAAKWYGEDEMMFMSKWGDGFEEMMAGIHGLLEEADAVIGFNSDKFDIKRVNAEFLRLGWPAPSPYGKIDLCKQAKKHFAFSSNRLKDLLSELGLTPKLSTGGGMELWIDVYFGKKAAQKRMEEYNKQDVLSTEELYDYMLGWINPHPNWGLYVDDDDPTCPNCGSDDIKKHKIRRTKVRKYQQWQCQNCGSYHRGRKCLETGEGVLA
jgi:predicted RNA-binding Zn-ribbon protein involved in translation (DUF1610 family)/DNA polymerase elongation subunit (family B)